MAATMRSVAQSWRAGEGVAAVTNPENFNDPKYLPLKIKPQNARMSRLMAALAFMVGTDIYVFDGKYTHALSWVAFAILHVFRLV
jgi:hypothetical protein